jgi:Putative MetA-pathway of phenol degradation
MECGGRGSRQRLCVATGPRVLAACGALVWFGDASSLRAQELEPRLYANVPVGINFLVSGYSYTSGGLAFDPALPLSDPDLEVHSAVMGFARSIGLWGRSGKVDALVPYGWLSGTAFYRGDPVERTVDGFGDPVVRLSINLYGAPALRLEEFPAYRQDLIVGAALQVSIPLGQYDETRALNLGTNRWFFRPSLGVSKAAGHWIWEMTAAATLFTDNADFFGGSKRSQDPLYSLQAHVIRDFRSGAWGAVDVTYFWDGETTTNGSSTDDRQSNWRVGATVAVPVDARNSIKLVVSDGVSARTGNSYSQYILVWQYRWGGGI